MSAQYLACHYPSGRLFTLLSLLRLWWARGIVVTRFLANLMNISLELRPFSMFRINEDCCFNVPRIKPQWHIAEHHILAKSHLACEYSRLSFAPATTYERGGCIRRLSHTGTLINTLPTVLSTLSDWHPEIFYKNGKRAQVNRCQQLPTSYKRLTRDIDNSDFSYVIRQLHRR